MFLSKVNTGKLTPEQAEVLELGSALKNELAC